MDLYQKLASGAGQDEVLLKSDVPMQASDWSRDGRFILYATNDPKTNWDLWVLPMTGDRKPIPFLQTGFSEREARFSPDARWIAYTSDESGRDEVYVQSFPASGGKWQISTTSGSQPQWRHDGKELFYLAPDQKLMAVAVQAGSTFEAEVPKALFEARTPRVSGSRNYDAGAADGQRFLINTLAAQQAAAPPITVVVNWLPPRP